MQVLYLRLRSRAGVRTEDAAVAAGADADVALHDNYRAALAPDASAHSLQDCRTRGQGPD